MKNSNKSLLLTIAGIFFCFCSIASAQQRDPSRGFQAGNSYSVKGFDAVNVSNGNVIINLPIASLPAGRGTSPGAVVTLQYNSKLWDSKQTNYSNHLLQGSGDPNSTVNDYFYTANRLQVSDRGGWRVLYHYNLIETNRGDLASPDPCNGGSIDEYNTRWKMEMEFPDGSVRQFIPVYGATKVKDGYYNINSNGLDIHYSTFTNPATGLCYVNGGENQYTTGEMTYMTADGSRYRLFVPYQSNPYQTVGWKLYSPDGTVVEASPPDDPTVTQRITERNGGIINIKPTEIVDQLGRSIVINGSGVTVKGVGGENITTQIISSPRYVHRKYRAIFPDNSIPQGTEIYDEVNWSFYAVSQVILPTQAGGQSYLFDYNADTIQQTGTNYTNGWGELKSVTLPSGAKADYVYDAADGTDIYASTVLESGVNRRDLTYTDDYDGVSSQKTDATYYYSGGGFSSVVNPDGTGTSEAAHYSLSGSFWDSGLAYRTLNSDGTKVERIWKQNLPNYSGSSYPYQYQVPSSANAYVKTEFTSIADAANQPTLTAIKDFEYDKNGNVTKIVEYDWVAYGSVPRLTDRPTGIPSNAVVKRITVNRYYNQAPDADSTTSSSYTYENANSPKLKNVIKSTEVQNAAGTPVARSEFYYDDPNNKGNLTETRTWDSTKQATLQAADGNGYRLTNGNYISTSATYDSHGNPLIVTDAMGVQSTMTYGAIIGPNGAVYDLYPTQTVTASNHAAIKRTSTIQYDFYTGLPTSATDEDNNLTSATDYDALGRPLKVKTAVGTPLEIWTQTEYDDVNRRTIVRSDVAVKGDGKRIGVQHLDQLGRVRLSRTIENAAAENPYNEADGIKVQTRYSIGNPHSYQLVSNPYRAATSTGAANEPSMGWTRSKAVNTGKRAETETFSGAELPAPWSSNTSSTGKVQTDIDADRTLVTDQAGKQRLSKSNALGQLTDVWEITAADSATMSISFPNQTLSAGYHTSYQYDTLSNLVTVNQGTQTRSFTYSSLSRLKSATNPETGTTSGGTHTPGTISYLYDDNGNLTGKTDPRNVVTTYAYDALNRVLSRSYTNEPTGQLTTPNVSYTYDNLTNAKGKLTKVMTTGTGSNTFSAVTDYQLFDKLGRVTQSQQTIDGVTYGISPQIYKYNLSGALLEQTYPSGRVVKNVLDNEGDLALVQSKKNSNYGFWNYAKSFTYTAAGAVSSMQLGNGKWESTVFNSRLQPTQIALGSVQNGTDQLKLNYTYNTVANNVANADNNGNVLSQTITVPTETRSSTTYTGFTATQNYTYDSLNRLKSAEETIPSQTGWKQTFKYDCYGNRQFEMANTTTPNAQSTTPKVVNPEVLTTNNRFKQDQDNDSVPDYLYDASGNTTKDANNKKFTYDGENKQTKVETVNSSGTVTSTLGYYFYDGDGKRVKKVSATETVIFIYDASGKLVAEYANQTAITPEVSYLTQDNLGSSRINTDQNGQVISRHDYQPFGEEIYPISGNTARTGYSSDDVRKQFTSYERDTETDLDFAQARMYASKLGRFITIDPAPFSPANPQEFNRFIYVQNNPLKFIDPSGETFVLAGEDADFLVTELENRTGYKLDRNKKTGVVTIVGNRRKPNKGEKFSDKLADKLKQVVAKTAKVNGEDKEFTVTMNTEKNGSGYYFDNFQTRTIDIGDYKASMNVKDPEGRGDEGAFVATQLGHVLEEYFQAETTFKNKESEGNDGKSPWFKNSHDAGLVFESQVLSDFTGQAETKRQEDSRTIGGGYIYSSQRYTVFYNSEKDVSVFQINRRPIPKE